MSWVEVPPQAPLWMKEACEECGKTVWRWLTRVNPQALTEEDFLAVYEVDEEGRRIKVRAGNVDAVRVEYDTESLWQMAAQDIIEWPVEVRTQSPAESPAPAPPAGIRGPKSGPKRGE